MPVRRTLDFRSLEEVLPDVECLLAGHTTIGRWTLGQILQHLATALRLTLESAPKESMDRGSDALRKRFFKQRRFPGGVEVPHPRLLPRPDADAEREAVVLREAIVRWASATGPFPEHPLLGAISGEEWHQFHCIHCAHHLSFAIPSARG